MLNNILYYFKENLKIIIIILLIIISILLILLQYKSKKIEKMSNNKEIKNDNLIWAQNKCQYKINSTLSKVLEDNNMKEGNIHESSIILPCTYDDIEKEINELVYPKNTEQKYFLIDNIDKIVAKDSLWSTNLNYYGREITSTMMPKSYVLSNNTDIELLKNEYIPNKLYIMKKNIQRQEGIKITDSLKEILNGIQENYVIVQELLQNPYLIDGRKINMRFYVLITCKENNLNIYVYKDGFMYYTKEEYKENSKKIEHNITTGYIDREVYEKNPLTHLDFKNYLDKEDRKLNDYELKLKNSGIKISSLIFNRINSLLRQVLMPYIGKICTSSKIYLNTKFQLFGADISLDDNLFPMIMEINKGPDMGSKDERDGKVKYNCMKDIFKIINQESDTDFEKILTVENSVIKL